MACAATPNGSTRPCNGWSACSTTAAASTFGDDIKAQLTLASSSPRARSGVLQTLRFSATPWAFAFLREGMRPTCWSPTPPMTAIPTPWSCISPAWRQAAAIDLRTYLGT